MQKVIVEHSFSSVALHERSGMPVEGIGTPEQKIAERLRELGPGWKVRSSSTTTNLVHYKEKTPMFRASVLLAFITTVVVTDD